MSAFLGHNIARGSGGDDEMNPKPNKKLSLGGESYGTIAGKGFFRQSQVLLSSIVDTNFLNALFCTRLERFFLRHNSNSSSRYVVVQFYLSTFSRNGGVDTNILWLLNVSPDDRTIKYTISMT